MPNSTLCLTLLSSSQGLQTLGLPDHAHFFSTQPAINGAKQGTQISMRIGKDIWNTLKDTRKMFYFPHTCLPV